jgi:UDP-glucose 4-epimerase
MKILVCGSEGRLMSATIPHLLQSGHEVVGVDNCEKWGLPTGERRYEFVKGDCSDSSIMRPLLKGVDAVIQAAATLFGVVGFHRRCADILSRDLAVQHCILSNSVRENLSRVVYISSSMVYEQCQTEPHREEDTEATLVPLTDYGLSKLVGERLSRAYEKQYGLSYTIWRPFNVIDPHEEGSDDPGISHVFADLIRRVLIRQQNPVEILGDGDQVRSFVHIREVGQALARFSFESSTQNQIYNVGSSEVVSVRELAKKIYEKSCSRGWISNTKPLEFVTRPVYSTDVRRRVGCFEKMRRDLNWASKISLDQALEEALEYAAEQMLAKGA